MAVDVAQFDYYAAAPDIGQFDYYTVSPDTLSVAAAATDSLARAVVNGTETLFGVTFRMRDGKVVQIADKTMTGRADGIQDLATELYDVALGINAVSGDNSTWLEQIYDLLYVSRRSGDVVTKVSIPDLMQELSTSELSYWRSFWNSYVNTPYKYNGFHYNFSNGATTILSGESVPNLLAAISSDLYGGYQSKTYLNSLGEDVDGFIFGNRIIGEGFKGLAMLLSGPSDNRGNYTYLGLDGSLATGPASLMSIVGEGFLGLAHDLWPDRDDPVQSVRLDFVSPDDGLSPQQFEHDNLAQLIAGGFSGLQVPLARLAYVYADPDDIDFKRQEEENLNSAKDSFFGDGEGAINPGQIKDAAGISSNVKGAFSGAGSPGDAFVAINDSNSYWFFSQEVADALDMVGAPAAQSDDPDSFLDSFVQDEEGFYSLSDLSPWDVRSYLRGD